MPRRRASLLILSMLGLPLPLSALQAENLEVRRLPAVPAVATEMQAPDGPQDRADSTATAVRYLQPASTAVRLASGWQPSSDEFASGQQAFQGPPPLFESGGPLTVGREFASDANRFPVGADLYSQPDFAQGLVIRGPGVTMKFGGYVKADFIYDFDAIDSTDSFVTTEIPVGAPQRTNARYHARQTRFSFDTRWPVKNQTVRAYVEGDFFSDGNDFRLRHAYGEVGSLLVGQTWTTFTDVAAAPATLDFEGSVSSVNRRQAQARWTQPMIGDELTFAASIEDTVYIIEAPVGLTGEPRTPSPDFVIRLRLKQDWGQFQIANLYRIGGFQLTSGELFTGTGWGINFTGVILLTEQLKTYCQVLYGDGIGSYRNLPDAAPTSNDASDKLGIFGWMVGVTNDWTEDLSSNFTYAENSLDNTPFQPPDAVSGTSYLAANLIWSPLTRVDLGIEYLYGTRENVDGGLGKANRLQVAFIFYLP